MRKFLVIRRLLLVTCVANLGNLYAEVPDAFKNEFQNDEIIIKYGEEMYVSGQGIEKLYNDKAETLKKDTLDSSFLNAAKLARMLMKEDDKAKIGKANYNVENYKDPRKINALTYYLCLNAETLKAENDETLEKNIAEKVIYHFADVVDTPQNGQRIEEALSAKLEKAAQEEGFEQKAQTREKKYKEIFEKVLKTHQESQYASNYKYKDNIVSRLIKSGNAMQRICSAIFDTFWYIKNFKAKGLLDKILKAVKDAKNGGDKLTAVDKTKKAAIENYTKSLKRNSVQHAYGINNIGSSCYFNTAMQALYASTTINKLITDNAQNDDLAWTLDKMFGLMEKSTVEDNNDIIKNLFWRIAHLGGTSLINKTSFEMTKLQEASFDVLGNVVDKIKEFSRQTNEIVFLCPNRNDLVNGNYVQKKFFESSLTEQQKKGISIDEDFVTNGKTDDPGNTLSENTQVIIVQLKRHASIVPAIYKEKLKFNKKEYALSAVINHSGVQEGGHYFAYVKGRDGTWHEQNDSNSYNITLFGSDGTVTANTINRYSPRKSVVGLIYERVD